MARAGGGGVDEGQRDCTVAKLCGHLLRRFVDPFVVLELMQCWNATRCRPPLPEEDVTRIVEFDLRQGTAAARSCGIETNIEMLAEHAAQRWRVARRLLRLHADALLHLRAVARDVAGQQRQRPHPAHPRTGRQRHARRARGSTSTKPSSK